MAQQAALINGGRGKYLQILGNQSRVWLKIKCKLFLFMFGLLEVRS